MAQIRKKYISDEFVIVNNYEIDFNDGNGNQDGESISKCIYCPGNEHLTKPAVLALVQREGMMQRLADSEDSYIGDWCVRVVESNKPLCSISSNEPYTSKSFYSEPAYGYHYILVATREHCKPSSISMEQWANVLTVLQDRVKWLYAQKGVGYVAIYMDYNARSDWHPHLNLLTFTSTPPSIEKEVDAASDYFNDKGSCPFCNIVNIEARSDRQLVVTDNFVSFCPWAPTHSYEFWIVPRKHTQLTRLTQKEIDDLALMLKVTLAGLHSALGSVRFGLVFRTSPEKSRRQLHWHIEVYPQVKESSALEYGYGISSTLAPEKAAERLSHAMRREFARIVGVI
jgi:UDPglucose--hexose-1-phosphate uridylyltransferase